MKKVTTERAAKNPARYDRFSDRIKELIKQFNAGLLGDQETLDAVKDVAEGVSAADDAHADSGLPEKAFDLHAILETFKQQPQMAGEPEPAPYGEGDNEGGEPKPLSAMQQAALDIDALYASDDTAPMHWQDKSQLRKELRGKVRRLVKDLGLEGWAKQVPMAVEHYAVIHYSKP